MSAAAPQVSVVLATHGDSENLPDTLASVLAQQGVELECVLVCDGPLPLEPSRTLLDLASQDSRLRVLELPHGGLTRALIAGCAAARGAAIARLDVGDRMQTQRLRRQLAVLRRHPACVLVSSHVAVHGPAWEPLWVARGAPDSEQPVRLDTLPPEQGLAGDVPHHGSVLFRRDAYERVSGYRPQFYFAQDWDLWYRLAGEGSYWIVPEILTRVRLAESGLSSRHWREQRRLARCCLDAFIARSQGCSEAEPLLRASAVRPDRRPLWRCGPSGWIDALSRRGDGAYFIGEALRRRGDIRCRRYLLQALQVAPWRLRSWLRLGLSLLLAKTTLERPNHPHIAMVCIGFGGVSTVAGIAFRQAGLLSTGARLSMVSDRPPADSGILRQLPGAQWIWVRAPRFRWLRRFCHLPAEVAFDFASLFALLRLHRRHPVDVVLCHSHPVAALTALPFRALCGVPFAIVCHGDIFERPPGTYEPALTCLYRSTTPLAYRQADLVVALSPMMLGWAQRGGAAPDRLAMIPNGIDAADIGLPQQVEPPAHAQRPLRVLFVGRIEHVKGADVLLEAWRRLASEGWAGELRMVGALARAWQPEFKRLCDLVPPGSTSLDVLEPMSRTQLGAHYLWADVVVIPSRSDPLPTVALEAMAAARVIVGSDVGGIPYLLDNGKAGVIISPGDAASLERVLRELSQDPIRISRLGAHAHARQAKCFTWSASGETLSLRLRTLIR